MQELFDSKPPKPPKISRRAALRIGLGGVATAIAGVTLPSGVDYVQEKIGPEGLKEDIKEKVEFIKSKYNIPINGTFLDSKTLSSLRKTIGLLMDTQYEEASLVKISRALDYLVQEFSKYPSFFVKNLHIPSINIVDSLVSYGDETTTGSTSLKKSGLENYITLEISSGILDKDKSFGWSEKEPFKHTIHHELFHVIFNAIDNSSGHTFSTKWASLYDPEDYGTKPYKGKPGFISEYGQQDSDEDFSDTASAMMNNLEGIFDKVEKDEKLKRKVDFLKQVIFKRSLNLCNQEYWDLSKKGSLTPDFFKKRKAYLLSLDFEKFKDELKLNNWENRLFVLDEDIGTDEKIFDLLRKQLQEVEV